MSHAATNRVIQQRGLKPAIKIVLWHPGDRHNPDYGCFPTQARLAEDAEMSISALNDHLATLEDLGLIHRIRAHDPHSHRRLPTRYILGFDQGFPQKPPPESGDGFVEITEENNTPSPETAGGANSGFPACPSPDFGQSHLRNPEYNLVREPLTKPVKEENAQAREIDFDLFFSELRKALSLDPNGTLPPGGKAGQPGPMCAGGAMISDCPRTGSSRLPSKPGGTTLPHPMGPKHWTGRWNSPPAPGMPRTWPGGIWGGCCQLDKAGFRSALPYFPTMENSPKTSVLYNANCPICSFEIGHYARYAGNHSLPIRFDDLNTDARNLWGLDADTAARRLYVLHDGTLTSGIPAFLVLWAQMPRYQWLARVVGLPGIRQIASLTYDFLLAPVIYRWHLRRLRKQPARTAN